LTLSYFIVSKKYFLMEKHYAEKDGRKGHLGTLLPTN
jgi:hypothetical protein